jgi:hypothetical protein
MSLFPCSVCGVKPYGKLAVVYSAWFNAEGQRNAWKQRLDVSCAQQTLATVLANASDSSPDVVMCPACGKDASEDLDPIYLTLYLPKQPKREYALTTDAPCAAQLRLILQQGAAKLPDRNGGNGGDSPRVEDDDWKGFVS